MADTRVASSHPSTDELGADGKIREAGERTPTPETDVMAKKEPTTSEYLDSNETTNGHNWKDEKPQQDPEMLPSTDNTTTGLNKPPMSLGREIAFVAVVCCGQGFTQASIGQVIPILEYIGKTFGELTPGQLSWFPSAFSLTTGAFIVIAGQVGDIFGHKRLFIFGLVWCSLWALLAGLSAFTREQVFFDFCRAMQGIGCAMIVPTAVALLGRTYPAGSRRKAVVFAIFAATAPNGLLAGALFASICAQLAWWPWAFWLMAICCAALAALSFPIIPAADNTNRPSSRSFDYIGAILGIAGLILFNVAWNQAPTVGWQSSSVITLLILGFIALAMFLYVERRVKQPLLPLSGFSKEVGFVLGCTALGWASFGIWLLYTLQFLEILRKETPLLAVAHLSPILPASIVAGLLGGRLLNRVPPGFIMLAALVAFCLGNIFVATMEVGQIYWAETFLSTIFTSIGMNLSFAASTFILSNSVAKEHQGIAASLVLTVVNYFISIGLGIGGTVQSQMDPHDKLMGFRGAFYAGIGLAGCGILLAGVFTFTNLVGRHRKASKEASVDTAGS